MRTPIAANGSASLEEVIPWNRLAHSVLGALNVLERARVQCVRFYVSLYDNERAWRRAARIDPVAHLREVRENMRTHIFFEGAVALVVGSTVMAAGLVLFESRVLRFVGSVAGMTINLSPVGFMAALDLVWYPRVRRRKSGAVVDAMVTEGPVAFGRLSAIAWGISAAIAGAMVAVLGWY
jgi:hypothetical protein